VPPPLERLARTGHSVDDTELARLLPELLEDYRARLRQPLGPIGVAVDGREYPTLLDALADPAATFSKFELDLSAAGPSGVGWEYLPAVERIEADAEGAAELRSPAGAKRGPQRAVVRVLLREHHPVGGGSRFPKPEADGVPTIAELAQLVRQHGISPFQLALLLYTSEERFRLEVDLVGNALLPDRRAGRLPIARRVRRSSRVSHGVDSYVARGELALANARALEVLVDTHGLTDVEMAHVLGGVRELGRSVLEGLRSRHLATFDGRLGVYRPRLDTFVPATDRLRRNEPAPRAAPVVDPALRTSVAELLAAADARATCPVCGDVLPPGHRAILCVRCQQEMGVGA
jgi:hypothetical protein